MRSLLLIAAICLSGAARAAGQTALDAELEGIVDYFYDLRFDQARAAADAVIQSHPAHPAGYFYRSLAAYQRFVAEDPKNPATIARFDEDNARAARAAQAWLSTSPAIGHYYLGAAHGFRGRVLAARRKYFRALPEALRGVRELKRALALDPALEDAYLGLGMYHYFSARMPAAAKPFAFLLTGEGGDRLRGLAELERVSHKGSAARMEARSILAAIYASDKERQWDKASAYLSDLMTRYPRNPLYRLRRVCVELKRGGWAEAAALADPDGPWIDALEPSLRAAARAAALYRAAEALLFAGKPEEARKRLDELERDPVPGDLKPWIARRRRQLASGLPSRPDLKPWSGLEVPN